MCHAHTLYTRACPQAVSRSVFALWCLFHMAHGGARARCSIIFSCTTATATATALVTLTLTLTCTYTSSGLYGLAQCTLQLTARGRACACATGRCVLCDKGNPETLKPEHRDMNPWERSPRRLQELDARAAADKKRRWVEKTPIHVR